MKVQAHKVGLALIAVALATGVGMIAHAMAGQGRCEDAGVAWSEARIASTTAPGARNIRVRLSPQAVDRLVNAVADALTDQLARAVAPDLSGPLAALVRFESDATNVTVTPLEAGAGVTFDLQIEASGGLGSQRVGARASLSISVPLEIRDGEAGPVLGVAQHGVTLSAPSFELYGGGGRLAAFTARLQERMAEHLGEPAVSVLGRMELARLGATGIADTALDVEATGLEAGPGGALDLWFSSGVPLDADVVWPEPPLDADIAVSVPVPVALGMARAALVGDEGLGFTMSGERGGPIRVVPHRVTPTPDGLDVRYAVHRGRIPCANATLDVSAQVRVVAGTPEIEVVAQRLVDADRRERAVRRALPGDAELSETLTELAGAVLAAQPVRFAGDVALEIRPVALEGTDDGWLLTGELRR